MSTKISENTNIQLDLKTVVAIIMVTASFVGMYYTLQADIEEAKKLPPIEVTRLEYELKEEWNEKMILQLTDQVEMLQKTSDILKEEIEITSAMLQDGTEADGKFEELQRQLEELESRKPKTTVIAIIMVTASFVGMYYTLQADIEEARKLPPIEVTRLEYELKEEWNEDMIMQLKEAVEVLEETQDILKEEIKITSAMLQDGTEADGKFEELQRQLEELENKKPSTRVIVKEVKVDKKGRKL